MSSRRPIQGRTPNEGRLDARWRANAPAECVGNGRPPLTLTHAGHLKAQIDEGRSLAILEQQRFYATGVSILAATFIILTTLSMGISERVREFAMLRAIAD